MKLIEKVPANPIMLERVLIAGSTLNLVDPRDHLTFVIIAYLFDAVFIILLLASE